MSIETVSTSSTSSKQSMPVSKAVYLIMLAIDTKMRKVFFPNKAWYANYIRPFVPDMVDKKLYQLAKL
jgi:hypothetical protein